MNIESYEKARTHCSQMLVIFLHELSRVDVVLYDQQQSALKPRKSEEQSSTYLDNLLVGHSSEENILFAGVELYTVGDLSVGKGLQTLTCETEAEACQQGRREARITSRLKTHPSLYPTASSVDQTKRSGNEYHRC